MSPRPAAESTPEWHALQAAAEWFAVMHADSVSPQQHRELRDWLASSPLHRQAWQRVESLTRSMALPAEQAQAAEAALAAASRLRSRRRAMGKLSVLLVTGLGGWGVSQTQAWRRFQSGLGADFRTDVGQIAQFTLQDDSRIWLNTASAVDQRFNSEHRRLVLRRGEILVDTHPDTSGRVRPFLVDSAQGRMQALGTRFSVRQFEDMTELQVYEGRVQVSPANLSESRVVLPGQRLRFTRHIFLETVEADASQASWHDGILLVDGRPLGQVVEELARYQRGWLVCDPGVAHLRVVGAYPLHDPAQALRMLEATLSIEIHARLPWWIIVRPR